MTKQEIINLLTEKIDWMSEVCLFREDMISEGIIGYRSGNSTIDFGSTSV